MHPDKTIAQLRRDGDFLSFTCRHEWELADPLAFTLGNGAGVSIPDTGVIRFEPPAPHDSSADIIISCGVHGNETGPIELCQRLVAELLTEQWTPNQRVLFLFANPAAMNLGERFVEENMNRLFSGAHSRGRGSFNRERQRAKALELQVTNFYQGGLGFGERRRYHYDLHTAMRDSQYEKFVIYPYPHGKPYRKDQLQFLAASGINTILLAHAPTTTFSYFSAYRFGADAFTVELGKVRPFGENDPKRLALLQDNLVALIQGQALRLAPLEECELNVFQATREILRLEEDFELTFPDDQANFSTFPVGHVLARDGEKPYPVEVEGEAIIFPNAKVALGQRALLLVAPTALDKLDLE